jgi:chorismate dehydratase
MSRRRLGAVEYLNARPHVWGLDRHAERFSIRFDIPAVCAALLQEGAIDLGLIPSIEGLRAPDYRIVPGIAIGSNGPVASVALYSTGPVETIRTIALDSSSRTSVALLRILCAKRFQIEPAFVTLPPDPAAMLARCDGALVIGDLALLFDHERAGVRKLDLGEEWTAWTGLPFVYACWFGRPGRLEAGDAELLRAARDAGVAVPDAVAAAHFGGDAAKTAIGARYLRDNIQYGLGDTQLAGLARFYREAWSLGLSPAYREPRFF